jgi:hypothetical protein
MDTTTTADGTGLRRVTGWLLVIGAVAFAVAATVLSSTFDWPDIRAPSRRPTSNPAVTNPGTRHRATVGADA